MNTAVTNQLKNSLKHLYISPLESCNLRCQICYTAKTKQRLSNLQMKDFISRYQQVIPDLQTITFCGGEVFMLPDFPDLVNHLTSQNLFIQIITNGTLNRLKELSHPNQINLIVSLDGLPNYHDLNRGSGHFIQSLDYLKSAQAQGFHYEIFSIVTKENMPYINQFEEYLTQELGRLPPITYHPRKPLAYLSAHPISNRVGETKRFGFITASDRSKLGRQRAIFPPPKLGCYQISLMSDGQVYGCCEGITPIGHLQDNSSDLITKYQHQVLQGIAKTPKPYCLGCIEPDFLCGLSQSRKGEPCP